MARELAVWFHRSFGDPTFRPGPFIPPPDPAQEDQELRDELERLRQQLVQHQRTADQASLTAAQEAELRRRAEADAKEAFEKLSAALSLAEETGARLAEQREEFKRQLDTVREEIAARPPERVRATVEQAHRAAGLLELDEAATRKIIDQQLRDAGWEADSEKLNYRKGTRPQEGVPRAVAEWPTESGPADYVLFLGLTPVAAVEAKRANTDVAGKIPQAKRYARDYRPCGEESMTGPWGEYRIPFCYSANGRPYLRQIETKSGIWFLDARRPTNHPRALDGWHTPRGIEDMLARDAEAADRRLREEPPDSLPLRDYQREAVTAVEGEIARGERAMLVAMATGTGKTRTCIGLIYRLVKAGRFRRILFLVDRTALGEQTGDAFKDVKIENFQAFTDIYDVKGLGDVTPDPDTRVHIATVQGMVRRLSYSGDGPEPPVDAYDCVVVDECHRGYSLDRELGETELTFRDEKDYVSKYRRVLDHFDAVKVGLTATPALHTTEIFGPPVYSYGYRQAVIDGWLIDHEPPLRIVTKLAEDGISWQKGEVIDAYVPSQGCVDQITAPDEIQLDIDDFNRTVVTENFNRVVCETLARHIDPGLPGKTIVFCVGDEHADTVVSQLKRAFRERYGGIDDDAVVKITAAADKPLKLIRRLKNEQLPAVAVTVDLLSTGIDVKQVTNIVFLRRVRSRILYEQMLGRATRLCPNLFGPGEDKERFRVFDAVGLYEALEPYSEMRPVVVRPKITFAGLADEILDAPAGEARREIRDQIVAKLQRKRRLLVGPNAERLAAITGKEPDWFVRLLLKAEPDVLRDLLAALPNLPPFLDEVGSLDPRRVLISEHEDELRRVERGYGNAARPEDYIESFRQFVAENADKIPALAVVTQRPRELTRCHLRELRLALDEAGFTEPALRTAWRETTNEDVAATIIGYVRHVAAGQPLMPFADRVRAAVRQILASRPWTHPQRRWLERIGKQLELETVVDRDALSRGQFLAEGGGYDRLDKIFEGTLDDILNRLTDAIWTISV